jgi:hypothetical protein
LSPKVSGKVQRCENLWQLEGNDGIWRGKEAGIAVGRAIAELVRELLNYAKDAVTEEEGAFKYFSKENH